MTKPFRQMINQEEILNYFRKLDRKTQVRLLIYAAAGLFFIVFVFWPAWWVRPQILNEMTLLRSQIAAAQAQIRLEPQLLKEREKHETFIKEVHSRLSTEKEIQKLLGILAGVGEKSRVALLSSQPEDKNEKKIPPPFEEKYLSASYLITVEGGYHPLATFVSEIENYPKILRVEELSILPQEASPSSHLAEIKISAFSLREGNR